jgi:predicted alpha/beta-hydrolase family hydrolase
MTPPKNIPQGVQVNIRGGDPVTAIAYRANPRHQNGLSLILAHGAGADQMSDFMVRFAEGIAARGTDTITFNFIYSEKGRGIPDRSDKLEACYRGVIEAFHQGLFDNNEKKLAIGGKSMGGRIASQVAAVDVRGIAGIVMLGYPLHPPGRPDKLRTEHLPKIKIPMLFVQGARDAFGTPAELRPILKDLQAPADLYVVEGGDHSFKVPKRGGPPQEMVYNSVLDRIEEWLQDRLATRSDRNSV